MPIKRFGRFENIVGWVSVRFVSGWPAIEFRGDGDFEKIHMVQMQLDQNDLLKMIEGAVARYNWLVGEQNERAVKVGKLVNLEPFRSTEAGE